MHLAISSTPDDVARDFIPDAVRRGCVVIDESGYWRMDPNVPLVIPEVNPHAIRRHQGIIASPNCSTTQMVQALKPLHDAGRVRRVVVSTYQATSGAGLAGSRDLEGGTQALLAGEAVPVRMLPLSDRLQLHPADRLAQAPGLHLGRDEDGLRDAEDARRRLDPDLPDLRPRAGEQLPQREHPGRDRAEDHASRRPGELFAATPGLVVMDDLEKKVYPMPINCDRPRRDVHRPHPRGPFQPQRPGLLVRQRQPSQGRRHQRRADRRVAGERSEAWPTSPRPCGPDSS